MSISMIILMAALVTPAHVSASATVTPAAATATAPAVVPSAAPWWESYDDALRAIERSEWREAIRLLDLAIDGNPKSEAQARTYGMRFIAYFPYYYRGLAYFELKEFDRALAEFNVEKDRGATKKTPHIAQQLEFYVSSVVAMHEEAAAAEEAARRKLADAQRPATSETPAQQVVTTTAPVTTDTVAAVVPDASTLEITVTSPVTKNGTVAESVRLPSVQLHGKIRDLTGVTNVVIEVNGQAAAGVNVAPVMACRATQGDACLARLLSISAPLQLEKGMNRIVVNARNSSGGVKSYVVEIERK